MIHELKRLYSPIFVTRVDWLNYILFTDHLCGIWGLGLLADFSMCLSMVHNLKVQSVFYALPIIDLPISPSSIGC